MVPASVPCFLHVTHLSVILLLILLTCQGTNQVGLCLQEQGLLELLEAHVLLSFVSPELGTERSGGRMVVIPVDSIQLAVHHPCSSHS